MGIRALIAAILVYFVVLVCGQSTAAGLGLHVRELGLADIPTCGLRCMLSTIPATGCSFTDLDCVCHNEDLTYKLSACMLANCTMADTAGTVRVQADLCHLSKESKRVEVFLYTGIVYGIASLFVFLRIAGKLVSKRLSLDDYIVVAALILAALPLGCVLAMTRLGFGEHLWNLQDQMLLPILRFFLVASSTYVLVLGLIKVSLILFYLEIFKTRRFVISAYVLLGYIILNSLIIFLMTLFMCRPINSFWSRDIKGTCMDQQSLGYANSASAIFQDLMLLILPLVFIRNLQMKRYRKLAVGLMFAIGTFGCIATIVRLQALLAFKVSIDPTWDYVPVTIWTEVELAAGFVCACLPSIRILVVKILPKSFKKFFSQITHSSSKGNSRQKQSTTPQQASWKMPSDWINISHDEDEGKVATGPRKSYFGGLWTRRNSDAQSSVRRLGSRLSTHSESSSAAATRPPQEAVELCELRASEAVRRPVKNSPGEGVRALPEIGCLPERNYSDLDLARHTSRPE